MILFYCRVKIRAEVSLLRNCNAGNPQSQKSRKMSNCRTSIHVFLLYLFVLQTNKRPADLHAAAVKDTVPHNRPSSAQGAKDRLAPKRCGTLAALQRQRPDA
jgi:hypothetical protein